jgi:hypothetical protein
VKKDKIALVAPCGINCGDCGVHLARDKAKVIETLVARGFDRESLNEKSLPCGGGRAVKGNCAVIMRVATGGGARDLQTFKVKVEADDILVDI